MRVPTARQMNHLAAVPAGTAVMNPRRHDWRPLLNHGWVEPVWTDVECSNHGYNFDSTNSYLPPLRITADGLRALADAIDKHGQPEALEPQTLADARWWGESQSELARAAA